MASSPAGRGLGGTGGCGVPWAALSSLAPGPWPLGLLLSVTLLLSRVIATQHGQSAFLDLVWPGEGMWRSTCAPHMGQGSQWPSRVTCLCLVHSHLEMECGGGMCCPRSQGSPRGWRK